MDMVDIGLYASFVVFFIAAGAAILFPLINSLRNPAALGKSLTGVAALVVLFIIAYALSGDEVTPRYTALGVDAGASKMIGAGLTLFYFLIALSFIGIIYSEITKAFK